MERVQEGEKGMNKSTVNDGPNKWLLISGLALILIFTPFLQLPFIGFLLFPIIIGGLIILTICAFQIKSSRSAVYKYFGSFFILLSPLLFLFFTIVGSPVLDSFLLEKKTVWDLVTIGVFFSVITAFPILIGMRLRNKTKLITLIFILLSVIVIYGIIFSITYFLLGGRLYVELSL